LAVFTAFNILANYKFPLNEALGIKDIMEQEFDTYAYFWVSDFECDPEEISILLDLKPQRTFRKGDLINANGKAKIKNSFWQFASSLPRTEASQDAHISNLIEVMLQRKDVIIQLQDKYEVGINCVGYYHDSNPGFHMDADLIKSCAALGVSIDFDLYNGSGIREINA
jgi:hypothetical protein